MLSINTLFPIRQTVISTIINSNASRLVSYRFASKKSGGSSNNGRKSAGKRLGIKEAHGTLVETGNIIVRQRGYRFWPGEGVSIGRDHTIVAAKEGKVHIHYDVANQRRYISVDDGTMPVELYPTRPVVKEQLANMVDAQLYLSLDRMGKYEYICKKIKELQAKQVQERENHILKRVSEPQIHRKFSLVDLTLI